MNDLAKRLHRSLFGYHNGEMAHQYAAASEALARESRVFRQELLAFRQTSKDPLRDLIRIQEARDHKI